MRCKMCGKEMQVKSRFDNEPLLAICPDQECGVFYCGNETQFYEKYKARCLVGYFKPSRESGCDIFVNPKERLNWAGVASGHYRKMILD